MTGIVCSMVGATFAVAAAAEVIRAKKGISAVGNAQIDTAQSKFGGASALFDGSGDYLTVGNTVDNDLALTGTTWTVEYWARINAHAGAYQTTVAIWDDVGSTGSVYWFSTNMYNATNKMGIQYQYATNSGSGAIPFGSALSTGVWQHHAYVRNGNTLTAYLDGVSQGTHDMTGRTIDITGYNSSSNTSLKMTIGANTGGGGAYNGWLDEIRISNTARYTSGFTPSTTPFTNDANTVLLLHMDGTDASTVFEDDNGVRDRNDGFIVNTTNSYLSTTQRKFGGTSVYTNNNTDGNNGVVSWDYSNASTSEFNMNNYTNWTLEFWNYPTSWNTANGATGEGSVHSFVFSRAGTDGYVRMGFGFNRTGKLSFDYSTSGAIGGTTLQESGTSGVLNTWQHIALVKQGTTYTLYHNGVNKVSATISGTISLGSGSERPRLGGHVRGHPGYFDELRVSNTARYTTTFTPSTTPFVNDTNTLVLCHMDGTNSSTVVRDDNGVRAQKGIQAGGNAKISTTRSKFGGTSAYFDGLGDYLLCGDRFSFPNGSDFTIEFWVNEDVVQNTKYIGGAANDIFIGHDSSVYSNRLGVGIVNVGWYADFGVTLAADTWYHVAISRSGTTIKYFVDGDLKLTQTSGTLTTAEWKFRLQVGAELEAAANTPFNGYIDEVRVSNSARYTTTFTPSTTPFVNDSNTVLLMHMDGTNASTVFEDDNGVPPDWEY